MKILFLPSFILIISCFFFACATGRTDNGNTNGRDTMGIGFNTSGIHRSVPPPVGQNQPLGSVGMGSNSMTGTAAITELNQDKVLNENSDYENSTNIGLAKWEAANMNVSQFLNFAYQFGVMEITSGKLAEKKALGNEVRAYAAILINDYNIANKELEKIAKERDIKLTSGKARLEDLENLEGKDFDEKYISQILKDYRAKIAMYEKASSSSDEQIREFSLKRLPILKDRFAQAVSLNNKEE